MPFFAPWLQAPDYLGASEAGTRAGLSIAQMVQDAREHAAQLKLQRDEMNARAAQAADALAQSGGLRSRELDQSKINDEAANALREADLKQKGLFEGREIQNTQDKNSNYAARTLANSKRGTFFNTGGGLVSIGPDGQPTVIPGTQRPVAQQFNTVSTKTPAQPATDAIPADVTSHWIKNLVPWGAHIPDTTNSPAIPAMPYQPERTVTTRIPAGSSAASALTAPTSTGFTTVAPAVNALKPQSFIGTPGGQNGFDPRATGFTAGIAPAPSKAPRIFTDKSGAQYIYTGSADDPMSDKNPNAWNAVNQPDSSPTADAPASSDLEAPPDN